jgi:tetratricopeptide (TPR) repeat protein
MWLTERVKKTKREDEFLELVAHHYSQAAELASELGDVDGVPRDITALALEALERAASRAEWRELPVASHLLDHALRLVGSDDSPRRWRLLLRRASTRIEGVRDLAGARADAECVLREAAAAGDRGAEAGALTVIGEIQLKENDATGAVSTLERAAAMHQELDDRLGEAEALRALGMANQFLGHLDVAEDAIERALHAFEELGARRGEAWAFQNLAWIAFRRGRDDDAEARLLRSADMFVEVGDKGGIAWAFGLLGWVKLAKGLLDEAEKLAFEVLKGAEETGNRWGVAMMQALVAQVSLWQGRTERAVKKAKEAKRNFRELEDRWGEVQALVPLARGLVATGSIDDGLAVAQEALEVARCLDDPSMQFLARTLVTLLAVEIGDGSRALADGLEGVGADNYESLVGTDRLSALALALAQTDRAEEAVSRLEGYPADEEPRPARIAAVLAVAYACTGRTHEAVAAADDVARHDRKTYHDRLVAEIGAGLALARDGRASLSEERFDAAQAVVGPTEDRLSQALLMLARGRALEVLGSPGASDQIAEARTRLFAMGAGHDGWEAVFGQALGAQRV